VTVDPLDPPDAHGRCPECGTEQPLLSADDLKAHLRSDGEFCPESRGAPADAKS
jgi:hypothetical protein